MTRRAKEHVDKVLAYAAETSRGEALDCLAAEVLALREELAEMKAIEEEAERIRLETLQSFMDVPLDETDVDVELRQAADVLSAALPSNEALKLRDEELIRYGELVSPTAAAIRAFRTVLAKGRPP